LRLARLRRAQNDRGFALWEMLVLLVVLALFLSGVIVLASKGIESLQPKSADRQLREQGETLMGRLEALTREAIVIYASPVSDQSSPLFQHDGILLAADIDGDAPKSAVDAFVASSSAYIADGRIETVSITQPDAVSIELVARVSDGDVKDKTQILAQEVILTKILDARRPPAFRVEYEAGNKRVLREADLARVSGGLRITGLHIYLKLEDRGKTLELDRAFKLNNPAPVRATPMKDK